jgi:UDP-glucose 4-epimerase
LRKSDDTIAATLRGKTALVTGGCGAIGSNLVTALLASRCKVVVIDDLSSGSREVLSDEATLLEGSIVDEQVLARAFREPVDLVFHLAAHFANQNSVDHPEADLLTNGLGTLRLLEYARRHAVQRFVYSSSSCIYGDLESPALETTTQFHFDTPYAVSKFIGEQYVQYFQQHYKLPTVTLRLFNSFGPGEPPGKYRNVIPNFIAQAMRGEALTIYGSGEETRDFNWVGNVVQALVASAIQPEAVGEVFNIGSGSETRIIDLARSICRITRTADIVFQPRRSWDTVRRRCADISKARCLLGYSPDTTNFEEKLRLTCEWLKKRGGTRNGQPEYQEGFRDI